MSDNDRRANYNSYLDSTYYPSQVYDNNFQYGLRMHFETNYNGRGNEQGYRPRREYAQGYRPRREYDAPADPPPRDFMQLIKLYLSILLSKIVNAIKNPWTTIKWIIMNPGMFLRQIAAFGILVLASVIYLVSYLFVIFL